MRAYLGAAIRRAGESLGVLEVMRQRELPFGDADEQLLRSLADVVAVAVSNARQAGSLRDIQLRLSMLAEASAVLATSFDYQATLRQVAVLAVPTLADWCTVSLLNDNGTIRQLGSPHARPHEDELGSQLRVPLIARGRTLGALTLMRFRSNRAYDKDDLALAEDLARRCATAIDNARLYQQAQEALRARDQFLAIAAHELRGPLARLKSHTEVLLDLVSGGHADTGLQRQSLQRMNAAVDRLATLTMDLLDVSRLRRRMPLRRQSVDLASLVQGVVAEHSTALEQHRVVLELSCEPCRLNADPDRLGQVISNLLENAAKYSPPGGTVRVSLEVTRAEAVLSVTDQGIGLPPGAAERIFEPFSRAANVFAGNIPGLGLGLHICRQIVLRHGGRIWAESPGEGLGTSVYVWLPRGAPRGRRG
jgi:signal transduction histidine kinase